MTIRIETEGGDSFDAFTSAEVLTSVIRSSEASFEVGDDGSWQDLKELADLGQKFVAYVDETPRIRGRVEVLSSDVDPRRSSTVRFVVRSAISDLESSDVDLSIRIKNATIKEVIDQAIGRNALDPQPTNIPPVIYRSDVARNLMTGRKTKGGAAPKNIAAMTEQQAAPQPGDTKKVFIDRHLMRHGLMMWDGPDGEIVVGEPDDDQEAVYHFRCLLGPDSVYNNCNVLARTRDATGAPTHLTVFGSGGGRDFRRSKVSAFHQNSELIAQGFDRRLTLIEDGVKNKDMAQRTAARIYAERVRKIESVTLTTHGHSHEDGDWRTAYSSDTTADLIFETVGGPLGLYYVESVLSRVSPGGGDTTELQMVVAGTWSL